jgi:hypothetical protein
MWRGISSTQAVRYVDRAARSPFRGVSSANSGVSNARRSAGPLLIKTLYVADCGSRPHVPLAHAKSHVPPAKRLYPRRHQHVRAQGRRVRHPYKFDQISTRILRKLRATCATRRCFSICTYWASANLPFNDFARTWERIAQKLLWLFKLLYTVLILTTEGNPIIAVIAGCC